MVESFLDGKNSLKGGILAFHKDAAVKFKELAPEEKCRYATVEEGNELSEKQVSNKVSNIFTKLRDHTVSNIHS